MKTNRINKAKILYFMLKCGTSYLFVIIVWLLTSSVFNTVKLIVTQTSNVTTIILGCNDDFCALITLTKITMKSHKTYEPMTFSSTIEWAFHTDYNCLRHRTNIYSNKSRNFNQSLLSSLLCILQCRGVLHHSLSKVN